VSCSVLRFSGGPGSNDLAIGKDNKSYKYYNIFYNNNRQTTSLCCKCDNNRYNKTPTTTRKHKQFGEELENK